MTVYVTGATGFIGMAVCRELSSRGVRTVAHKRATDGDLLDLGVNDGLRGCDVIVHLAGLAHRVASPDAFVRGNVELTARVASAAVQQGASHFILVSSLGASSEPHATPYARSKFAAESIARDTLPTSLTIVRPALVYGPGDRKGNFSRLVRVVDRGLPVVALSGATKHVAYVDSVAECLADLAEGRPPSKVQAFSLFDEVVAVDRMVEVVARELGRRPRFIGLPAWASRAVLELSAPVANTKFGSDIRRLFQGGDGLGSLDAPRWTNTRRRNFDENVASTVGWYRSAVQVG